MTDIKALSDAEIARYGQTKIFTIRKRWDALRSAVRSQGTPDIQNAFDQMEAFAGVLMQPNPEVQAARDAALEEAVAAVDDILPRDMHEAQEGGADYHLGVKHSANAIRAMKV